MIIELAVIQIVIVLVITLMIYLALLTASKMIGDIAMLTLKMMVIPPILMTKFGGQARGAIIEVDALVTTLPSVSEW